MIQNNIAMGAWGMSIADCLNCPKGFVNDCLTRTYVIRIKSYYVFYSNRHNSQRFINFMTYVEYFKFWMGFGYVKWANTFNFCVVERETRWWHWDGKCSILTGRFQQEVSACPTCFAKLILEPTMHESLKFLLEDQ